MLYGRNLPASQAPFSSPKSALPGGAKSAAQLGGAFACLYRHRIRWLPAGLIGLQGPPHRALAVLWTASAAGPLGLVGCLSGPDWAAPQQAAGAMLHVVETFAHSCACPAG